MERLEKLGKCGAVGGPQVAAPPGKSIFHVSGVPG